MASAQCSKPANETCQQKCHGSSLGQKMSDMANWVKGNNNGQQNSRPSCQTQTHSCPNHAPPKTSQAHCYRSQAQTHQIRQGLAKPQAQCGNKAGGHHGHSHSHDHSHTKHQGANGMACQCANKTSCHHGHGHGQATSGVTCHDKTTTTAAAATVGCEQKKERNLFRRIKDRISGNSSCSDCSSSDSESDNECCHKRKN